MICQKCNDTGKVLIHRPTVYCTDSPVEMEDARQMASGPCPACGGKTPEQQIVALTAERDRLKRECSDYESEIASVCQEDYSLKECFDAMLGEIDRHIAARDQLRRALTAVEWIQSEAFEKSDWPPSCPKCERSQQRGHAPDCIIELAKGAK